MIVKKKLVSFLASSLQILFDDLSENSGLSWLSGGDKKSIELVQSASLDDRGDNSRLSLLV